MGLDNPKITTGSLHVQAGFVVGGGVRGDAGGWGQRQGREEATLKSVQGLKEPPMMRELAGRGGCAPRVFSWLVTVVLR